MRQHTRTHHEHYMLWIISNMERVGGLVAATLEHDVFETRGIGDDSGEDAGAHGTVNHAGLCMQPWRAAHVA